MVHVDKLHAKAQVRLIRTVLIHGIIPGHAAERNLQFLSKSIFKDIGNEVFCQRHNVVFVDEGHFHIKLGKFRLTVGAQVFIAEAAGNLEVFFHAGYHENLLKQLRRLRQGIELARVDTARDKIVTGAFRSALAEHRRFDFKEALVIHEVTDELRHFMTEDEVALHFWSAQVKITIAQSYIFIDVHTVLDIERRRLGRVQDIEAFDYDFHFTGRKVRVYRFFRTVADHTFDLQDKFTADRFRLMEILVIMGRVNNDLDQTGPVT